MARILGHLCIKWHCWEFCQWFDILARPLLSVFFDCDEVAKRMPQTAPQTLPAIVQSELFLYLSLARFWEVDLQRPWSPTVVAADVTDAFGFGVRVPRK